MEEIGLRIEILRNCLQMDLDAALKEIGQFGLFQGYYFTLLVLPVVLSAFRGTEYVFTTMNILHRSVADVMGTVATQLLH